MFLIIYRNKKGILFCIVLVLFLVIVFEKEESNDQYDIIHDNIALTKKNEEMKQEQVKNSKDNDEVSITLNKIISTSSSDKSNTKDYTIEDTKPPTKTVIKVNKESLIIFDKSNNLPNVSKKQRVNLRNYVKPAPCINCPGENGTAVILTGPDANGLREIMDKEFFNLKASDKISLWRTLPDIRTEECKKRRYDELPTASVIIIFTNERTSPILRTVYTVIHESPRDYLKEIILVDDQSTHVELKKPLEDYCEEHFGDIVRILRTPKRLGLIGAKNFGGRNATGDIIVFLDAHCEAATGWLEPLLARIKEDKTAIVCPTIESINAETLKYHGGGGAPAFGSFTWSLFFTWEPIPERIRKKQKSTDDVYPSATMAGGLFAANRIEFFSKGGFDDDMEIWGGENLELSFRTWMCGGSIEFSLCSHVGHIFRDGHPYNMTGEKGLKDVHGRNSMRLAEVWMDSYKNLFYSIRPDLLGKDFGNITSRMELRKHHKCKSFKWFLENVAPEKFIPNENVFAYGRVKVMNSRTCLDTFGQSEYTVLELGIHNCQEMPYHQLFSFSKDYELRRESICCFGENKIGSIVKMDTCNGDPNQKWLHTPHGQIIHNKSGLCMDSENIQIDGYIVLNTCNQNSSEQKWSFQQYY